MPCCNNQNNFPTKIATRLTRIYDGAVNEMRNNYILPMSNFTTNVTYPLTLLSVTFDGLATINDYSFGNKYKCKTLINVDYEFPVTINYVDALGMQGRATSTINGTLSGYLRLPNDNFTIELSTWFISRSGRIEDGVAKISGCLRRTLKVLSEIDVAISVSEICYPKLLMPEDLPCSALFDT